jgi:hypothetical protein
MVSRKRARDEMEADEPAQEPSTLHKLRNMWQFANLAQYLHLFLDALKFDKDFDIEVRRHCARQRVACAEGSPGSQILT